MVAANWGHRLFITVQELLRLPRAWLINIWRKVFLKFISHIFRRFNFLNLFFQVISLLNRIAPGFNYDILHLNIGAYIIAFFKNIVIYVLLVEILLSQSLFNDTRAWSIFRLNQWLIRAKRIVFINVIQFFWTCQARAIWIRYGLRTDKRRVDTGILVYLLYADYFKIFFFLLSI